MALAGVRRRFGDLVHHRPGVGDAGRAVATHLVPEDRGLEARADGKAGAARNHAADAHQQCRRVIDGAGAIDGVARESDAEEAVPKAERAQRPFVIRFASVRSSLPVKRMKARSPARPGFGPYRRARRPRGLDPLHVGQPRASSRSCRHTEEEAGGSSPRRGLAVVGVDDDPPGPARLASRRVVGSHHHGDGAEAVQRREDGQGARPRLHQDADGLALADGIWSRPRRRCRRGS